MKTKWALMTAVLAFSYTFSQERPMSPQLKSYSKKVDSIVVSEKTKMNTELDQLDKNYQEKKITSDEKQKQRTEIAGRYEEIINDKITAQQADLETATRETVKDIVMGKSRDQSLDLFSQNNAVLTLNSSRDRTIKELLNTFTFNISFGVMNLTGSASSLAINNDESRIRVGRSSSSQMEFRLTRQLGSLTSPVFYRIGLGYRVDVLSPEKPKTFVQDGKPDLYLTDFQGGTLRKSYLRNYYAVVPLDFVFVLNPRYTVENNEKMLDNSKGNLRFTAGIYGGIRAATQNYIFYKDEEGNKIKNREAISDPVNRFLFGGKLSLGYGALNIFIKKDFTPIFNDHAKIDNKYGIQVGLELLYLDF